MLQDLENAKALVGSPMGKFVYPKGLIRNWDGITAEQIDALIEQAKQNLPSTFTSSWISPRRLPARTL
jgi:3-hydroxybutyryl-CoA dehydrogenase